jgi:uncharacterized repeat protein (TIGR01451 family)
LAAYSGGTITITVTVNVGVDDGTLLYNPATLDYADANGNPYDQLSDFANVTVTAPVMTITKVANTIEADPGDNITYTLTYTNSGSGIATDVVVTDTIPTDTTFAGSDPIHNTSSNGTYTWYIGTVGAFSSGTITITVTVNAGVSDGTVLVNYGTLDYDDSNGNPYSQESDYANVTITAPVMSISKTADTSTANPGDQITYTILFVNSGTGNATNVWINDTIPADTTLVSTSPAFDYQDNDEYMWNFDVVEGGTNVSITIIVQVDAGTPDQTLLHNTVTLDYFDDNGNPLDTESAYADVVVTAPVMSITKTADRTTANPDDTIIYTITYYNSGTGWATLVTITDTIPADTTFVNSTPGANSSVDDTYTWNIGNVPPNGSGVIEIEVKVDVGTPDQTLLHNTATLDYADTNGNGYQQESDYADVVVTAPIMTITKTADRTTANPGDIINYTITYVNSGTGWATLVKITDTIPAYTTFVSSKPQYSQCINDTYIWNLGNVAPNTTATMWIKVTVDAYTPDTTLLHNVVTLDYADTNSNYYTQESDYADVVVTAPVMSITKTADRTTANPEDTIIYTITYYNSGTGWATLVTITDTIPADTTFVNSTPGFNISVDDTYTWNIGNVPPNGSGVIEIEVFVDVGTPDETLLHNTATLDYADTNANGQPQESDYADVVVTAPVMSIIKTADRTTANPGDTIVYTITYYNSGTGWATLVTVTDTIPADTTYVSSTPAYSSVINDTYTWNIGNVSPNSSGVITHLTRPYFTIPPLLTMQIPTTTVTSK